VKGSLPKAYLRIDPNLDQTHPDPGAFVRLLCAAARQPKRGRFKSWALLSSAIGKKNAESVSALGDVKPEGDAWIVDGWDTWQEGDLTVGDRMARFRERHRNRAVTEALPACMQDSKAVGSKAIETELVGSQPTPAQVRHGEVGEHERLTNAYVALLKEAAGEMGGHVDVLHAKAGRTPSGPAWGNLYACPTLPWLKTATEKLRAMLADHRADAADRAKPPRDSRAHLGAATPEEIERANRIAEAELAQMGKAER